MKFILLFILQFFILNTISQTTFSPNYFSWPVDLKPSISSNFGEIRPNHFHSGLDVFTQVKSGINILAAADGYISRIKVSPRGYGNALYITHPNGYVSVYGHLSSFKKSIADYIYNTQHNKQQFEVDMYPLPHLFPVKKGEFIAKSGNSGRSYGAHLHFEIREEISEETVNPLFAYDIKDNVAPKINQFYMYQFNEDTDNENFIKRENIKNINGKTIRSFGKIGFGIEIHDYISKNSNRFGAYEVDLFIDDSLYFSAQMNKISFFESRYLNSFVDYYEYQRANRKVTKCFKEPNNQLNVYKSYGSGIYNFSDGKLHKVKIVGKDIKGNSVNLNFNIQSDSTRRLFKEKDSESNTVKINCFKENEFSTDSFKIIFHRNCLYYDIDFQYSSSKDNGRAYSKYHYLYDRYVPLHHKATIAIKPDSIPDILKAKALIVGLSSRGLPFAVESKWKDEYIEAKISSFGTYFVSVDTLPPNIRSLSIDKRGTVKGAALNFKITDNLSGIEEYIGYIDNTWVLFEYDEKNNLITCHLPEEKVKRGKHFLVLWVKDYMGNIASFETPFTY